MNNQSTQTTEQPLGVIQVQKHRVDHIHGQAQRRVSPEALKAAGYLYE